MDKTCNIAFIRIGLENLETVEIDGKHIGLFALEDIKSNISVLGCNSFGKYKTATNTVLEISKDADEEKTRPFGYNISKEDASRTEKVFDVLIDNKNIADIQIFYTDGTAEDTVCVRWNDSDDYRNSYMSCERDKDGNLRIVISGDKGISDYFPEEREGKRNGWGWLRDTWGRD